jgi:hypothetical protein
MGVAVATRAVEERQADPGAAVSGLDGVLRALQAVGAGPCRTSGAVPSGPGSCGTWLCGAAVAEVRDGRGLRLGDLGSDPGPDPEFDEVVVRRLAHRHLRVVADHAAGLPVPRVWELLLTPPRARPARLALAVAVTLLGYDLTLAVVGACTVLGRTPGARERTGHHRLAALLAVHGLDLVRRAGDPDDVAAAVGLAAPEVLAGAWERVGCLWTLRGRPAEAEAGRIALDRAVHASAQQVLAGAAPADVPLPTGDGARRRIVP